MPYLTVYRSVIGAIAAKSPEPISVVSPEGKKTTILHQQEISEEEFQNEDITTLVTKYNLGDLQ